MVEMNYSLAYLKMLLALGAIVGVLLFIKRYMEKKTPLGKSSIKILSQQMLDTKNKISLVRYKDKEYLIATGESGFLIDRFDTFDTTLDTKLKETVEDDNDH